MPINDRRLINQVYPEQHKKNRKFLRDKVHTSVVQGNKYCAEKILGLSLHFIA